MDVSAHVIIRCRNRIKTKREAARVLEAGAKERGAFNPRYVPIWLERARVYREEAADLEALINAITDGAAHPRS